jgi:hypothetical protein
VDKPQVVKTGKGKISIEIPFSSKLKKFFRRNTDCLEKLTVEMLNSFLVFYLTGKGSQLLKIINVIFIIVSVF